MNRLRQKRYAWRRKEETRLSLKPLGPIAENTSEELLHELRVHQIELEMQNENLRQTQARLADSFDRYVELYDFSPVAYLSLTVDGTISQINPTGAELFGYSREYCLMRRFKHFVAPECHERVDLLFMESTRQSERQQVELSLRRFDGSIFQGELICRRMTPPHGPSVLHIALTDISERKRAEQELLIAATAFESQEGMLVMDSGHVVLRANTAFSNISGYTTAEVLGRKLDLFDDDRYTKSFYSEMWDTVSCAGFWQGEFWSRRKSGEVFPAWLTINAVREGGGAITHFVITLTDNTLRKAEEERIKHLAYYDSLTQLPNRQLLLNRLQQALAASVRSGREGALLFIDLDNFKALNDALGHSIGDLLLQQVAQRLNTCIREGDTVARLGGDEFVVMLEDLSGNRHEAADQIETVGEKILAELNKVYELDGHVCHSTPSIGAALFHAHRGNVAELLKSADLAMYHAKAAGRNALRFFDPDMQAEVTARIRLEAEMREGLQKRQFDIHYQAQVDSKSRLMGAEALLFWQHPVRNLLAPGEFIALAEDMGQIIPLGQWVLETVCRQLTDWSDQADMAHLTISVNISPREFNHPDFVNNVLTILARCGADPKKLCLELANNLPGNDLDEVAKKMSILKSAGVCFALDNFGFGTALFSCLKRLPLDRLKIGQPVVHNMPNDPYSMAIAKSIVVLGESLGLTVVAEGVENERQREALSGIGCQICQGYLFGRTSTAETLREIQAH